MSSPTIPSPSPTPAGTASAPPFDFVTWFELNRGPIGIAFGVVCAAAVTVMVIRARQQATTRGAAAELLALTPVKGPGQDPAPADPQKLLQFSQRFAGTPSAAQARVLAAGQLFADGKFSEAQSQFAGFEDSNPDSPYLGIALLGVGASLDAQNKTNDAVTAYDRVISLFPTEAAAQQARLAKARLIESSQPSQALAQLEDILKNEYALAYQSLAAAARSRLLAAHPELDVPASTTNLVRVVTGTNAPADANAR